MLNKITMFMKGWRTYLAVLLTALVVGLNQMGVMPDDLHNWLVGILTGAGLYFRAKA